MKITKYLDEQTLGSEHWGENIDMTKVPSFMKFAKIFGYDDGKCCGNCKFVAGSSTGRYYFCENEEVQGKLSTKVTYVFEIIVDPTSVCKYFKAK